MNRDDTKTWKRSGVASGRSIEAIALLTPSNHVTRIVAEVTWGGNPFRVEWEYIKRDPVKTIKKAFTHIEKEMVKKIKGARDKKGNEIDLKELRRFIRSFKRQITL